MQLPGNAAVGMSISPVTASAPPTRCRSLTTARPQVPPGMGVVALR